VRNFCRAGSGIGNPAYRCANKYIERGINRDIPVFASPLNDTAAHVVEHVDPDGGRKVIVFAGGVDFSNDVTNLRAFAFGNLVQYDPEQFFQADAGLVSIDNDGVPRHSRIHVTLVRCPPAARYPSPIMELFLHYPPRPATALEP
jgi:hypothetical protein